MKETGVIKEIGGIENVGAHTKRTIVIETTEYPRKIAFSAWNDKAKALDSYSVEMKVEIDANASSKEYSGKWYTELSIWKINKI